MSQLEILFWPPQNSFKTEVFLETVEMGTEVFDYKHKQGGVPG